ncbi:HPr family phosphocarrier protein [Parachlamydia sp. AcF125]|uniref:HPr family phosphocarrier protein n=1 Tax=Parachlamydia sp. AcF125 TaxID=2795736 RepID=UPI001BC9D572|nr:Phosphocarrier protein HPr [Parachlamydia sp. AcF125]
MKEVFQVHVKNSMGLHTRPATVIARLLQDCDSNVQFTCKKETVNAKSVLGILMLAAPKNSKIIVTIEGRDAEQTKLKLIEAFENKFWEDGE